MKDLENYFGAKTGSGMYQNIINLIPPHTQYYELFGGSLTVYRKKLPCSRSILNDLNPDIVGTWTFQLEKIGFHGQHSAKLLCDQATEILTTITAGKLAFVYLDPPYIETTRRSHSDYGQFEMTMDDHENLLSIVAKVDYNCMISCYDNRLYASYLKKWNKKRFNVQTRNGKRLETVYYNYEDPTVLHDYRYLGSNATDRQRIKRKIERNITTLDLLPALERNAILNACIEKFGNPQ